MKRFVFFLLQILLVFCFLSASFGEEEPLTAEVTLNNRLSMVRIGYYELEGELKLSKPCDKIICSITDERKMFEEYNRAFTPEKNALSFSLKSVVRSAAFSKLKAGEKTLRIICESGDESIVAFEARFTVLGNVGSYSEITKKCKFDTKQNLAFLKKGPSYYNYNSWKPSDKEPSLNIHFPDDANAKSLQIEWLTPPEAFSIDYLDANGNILSTTESEENYSLYCDTFDLTDTVRSVRITVKDYDTAICSVHVFDENGPEIDVQDWVPMPEKLDILHVSTHQDDELLFFGGSIPHHSAMGYETGVLYMADCGRFRYAEALSGLWICGLEYHPVFLNLRDALCEDYNDALYAWKGIDPAVELLTEQIRKYKPEVIVTHGEDGEYNNYQHKLATEAVLKAVEGASDPEFYPESFEKYGVWTVKKLYRHQTFGDNVIKMDWKVPLDAFDGRTALEMSEIGYNRHESQISYLKYSFGLQYHNDTFALIRSTVGPDVVGGNFFENLEQ